MDKIEYIFFDMGYTLVNEDKVWEMRCKEQSQISVAEQIGITADKLWRDIQQASISFLPQWTSVIDKYAFTQSARYNNQFECLYADVDKVLAKLSKHFKLGIIANQSSNLKSRLEKWGISKYFETIISSADCGYEKPSEEIFNIALKQSGCNAKNAVMVGDRLDNDIMPAKKIGMCTIRIKQGFAKYQIAPNDDYKADFEIDNLSELFNLPIIIDNLN